MDTPAGWWKCPAHKHWETSRKMVREPSQDSRERKDSAAEVRVHLLTCLLLGQMWCSGSRELEGTSSWWTLRSREHCSGISEGPGEWACWDLKQCIQPEPLRPGHQRFSSYIRDPNTSIPQSCTYYTLAACFFLSSE